MPQRINALTNKHKIIIIIPCPTAEPSESRSKMPKVSLAYDEIFAMEYEQELEREALKRKWEPGCLNLGEGPHNTIPDGFLGPGLRKLFKTAKI